MVLEIGIKRNFANNAIIDLTFKLLRIIFILNKQEYPMAFLKFLWGVIRALLIIVAALICMTVASFIWPLLLLLIWLLPQSFGRIWRYAGTIKVW